MHTQVENRQFTIGIVGAGIMGRGLAEAVAISGNRVILLDISEDVLREARSALKLSIRARTMLGVPGGASATAILERIQFAISYERFVDADFVVENVSEKIEVKRKVYDCLNQACRSDIVISANTSTFPIEELAVMLLNPQRLVGIHFMNPASTKALVEIIQGPETTEHTLGVAKQFLAAIGKVGILIKDGPGFVSNRVLMLVVNEAAQLVASEIASAEDVDNIFVGCFGHQMGPLATADLIGLDTILLSLQSLQIRLDQQKYKPSRLIQELVSSGRLGRKSGEGFYRYGA